MSYNIDIYCMQPPLRYTRASINTSHGRLSGTISIIKANNTFSTTDLENLVNQIHDGIRNGIRAGNGNIRKIRNITIYTRLLERINFDFTEKLILGLDMTFPLYHMGLKPFMQLYSKPPRFRTANGIRYPLIQKYFSGDVSGNIGESLFAYIATIVYGVSNIVHLRPEKASMLTPDFVIIETQDIEKLRQLLCQQNISLSYYSKLFVESKTSISGLPSRKKIAKGLAQLFRVIDNNDLGILFLVYRNISDRVLSAISVPLIRG